MNAIRALMLSAVVAALPLLPQPQAQAQVTQIDVQMASSAIMNAGKRATKVASLKKVPSVGVIRLDFRVAPTFRSDLPDPAEYRILASRNAKGVAKLQQALRSNPVTREVLARRGISPSQVAGVQVSSNGSLRLYIFSR